MRRFKVHLFVLLILLASDTRESLGLQSTTNAAFETPRTPKTSSVKVETVAFTAKRLSQQIGVMKISPNCSRFIMTFSDIVQGGKKPVVVSIDGEEKEYPNFAVNSIRFSEDSRRYGFSIWNGSEFQLVVDGRPVGSPAESVRDLVFSPDGRKFAYVTGTNDKYSIANTDDPSFPAIQSLTYSTDGKRLAYMGSGGTGATLMIDGKIIATGATHFPQSLSVGPNKAMIVLTKSDGQYVYDGSEVKGPFHDVPFYTLSRNGLNSLCVIQREESSRQELYVDSRKIAEFDEALDVKWANKQNKPFFIARDGEGEKAFVGSEVVAQGSDLARLTLMGKRGYGLIKRDPRLGDQLVIDGKTVYQPGAGERLMDFSTSAEGTSWCATSIKPGGKPEDNIANCTVNGQTSKNYNDLTRVSFSTDGKSWSYGAWDGNDYYIISHERTYGPFDSNGSPPMMSPDGKHFAFFGSTQEGQTGIFIDGELLYTALEAVSWNDGIAFAFDGDSTLNAVVVWSQKRLLTYFTQVRFSW